MDDPQTTEQEALKPDDEALALEMIRSQQALGEQANSTAQFLRFVLTLANENLGRIRKQLEEIQNLASEIESHSDHT